MKLIKLQISLKHSELDEMKAEWSQQTRSFVGSCYKLYTIYTALYMYAQ